MTQNVNVVIRLLYSCVQISNIDQEKSINGLYTCPILNSVIVNIGNAVLVQIIDKGFLHFIFKDVDECCLGGYCHMYATCTKTAGGYECQCMTGFIGNDTYCAGW
jgi:hypothetical protein